MLRRRVLAWAGGLGTVTEPAGPLGEAVAAAFAAGPGPVLALHPDAPRLHAGLAEAALADLAAGADLAIGPGLSGGWYLLALAAPQPALFGDGAWESRGAMERGLAAAGEAGLEVGLLRAERVLASERDRRAVQVDPLTPPEILASL